MSGNLSVIFGLPIICKTVKYIDKSDSSFHHKLSFNASRFGRLIADWAVENMNSDATTYGMLHDVRLSPKNK